jgi:adenosylhomocysteine nucleosidase
MKIRFGPIASGDEDVVGVKRRRELHQQTGALAVAWEGAGGARACKFSEVPYVEIRAITDIANDNAADDFRSNLEIAMKSLASLIMAWLEK